VSAEVGDLWHRRLVPGVRRPLGQVEALNYTALRAAIYRFAAVPPGGNAAAELAGGVTCTFAGAGVRIPGRALSGIPESRSARACAWRIPV